jgi:hypothetical protein
MSYEIRPGRPDSERPLHDEHVVIDAVGEFRQGNDLSQLVLRRYLLTRAIGESVVRTVHWFGVALLVLAGLVWWAGVTWLAVLIGIAGLLVLAVRALLSAIQRRISGIDAMGEIGPRVEQLVGQTRKGLRAELRRIGLPSAPWGPLLVGLRLVRPIKRVDTVAKLTRFDLSQVVPSSTLDELHLLLRRVPPTVR